MLGNRSGLCQAEFTNRGFGTWDEWWGHTQRVDAKASEHRHTERIASKFATDAHGGATNPGSPGYLSDQS